MKRKALVGGIITLFAMTMIGCSLFGDGTSSTEDELQATYGEPREITGQEALQLYGVVTEDPALAPTSTPLYFFPAQAWPMFTRPALNDGGTWMGDLEAGIEVVLRSVNSDRTACLVEGLTMQGWSTMGWVACNRLRFYEAD